MENIPKNKSRLITAREYLDLQTKFSITEKVWVSGGNTSQTLNEFKNLLRKYDTLARIQTISLDEFSKIVNFYLSRKNVQVK